MILVMDILVKVWIGNAYTYLNIFFVHMMHFHKREKNMHYHYYQVINNVAICLNSNFSKYYV